MAFMTCPKAWSKVEWSASKRERFSSSSFAKTAASFSITFMPFRSTKISWAASVRMTESLRRLTALSSPLYISYQTPGFRTAIKLGDLIFGCLNADKLQGESRIKMPATKLLAKRDKRFYYFCVEYSHGGVRDYYAAMAFITCPKA